MLWDSIKAMLPEPQPAVQPGKTLVGLPAWLGTNHALIFQIPPSEAADLHRALPLLVASTTT